MGKTFKLPEEVGNKLLNYLASKPYIEVHELIDNLKVLQLLEDIEENPDK